MFGPLPYRANKIFVPAYLTDEVAWSRFHCDRRTALRQAALERRLLFCCTGAYQVAAYNERMRSR